MVTLEQVKLLESKIARAIEYVERVTGENALLQGKLDSYQKRIDELEVVVQKFKEEQGRIEDGILSALDRLNQFEDAIEKSLSPPENRKATAAKATAAKAATAKAPLSQKTVPALQEPASTPNGVLDLKESAPEVSILEESTEGSLENLILFSDDVEKPSPDQAEEESSGGELDIF
jgi:chromosome segregation ATPase